MLVPRLYRAGLLLAALALIVFAFSLSAQPAALVPELSPDVYSTGAVDALMSALARAFPGRSAGSPGDRALAAYVASALRGDGFAVTEQPFTAQTANGSRRLVNVLATSSGTSPRMIVLAAPRDLERGPPAADLSGTAVLLELARVLGGQTHNDTLVLASLGGEGGGAGAARLAASLPAGSLDGVIVLGDLARARAARTPVIPWSGGQALAPPLLVRTLMRAVAAQSSLRPAPAGLSAQLAHAALPLAPGAQSPFGARGEPAVLLSAAGEGGPSPHEAVAPTQPGALGAAVLQAVDALDAGRPLPPPTPYLLLDGQIVPNWAVRVLVLGLILPVLVLALDAAARARRRQVPLLAWLAWLLSGAFPFLIALSLLRLAGAFGLITPAATTLGGAAGPRGAGGIALLALLALCLIGGLGWLRPWWLARLRAVCADEANGPGREPLGDGAAIALMLALCALALAVWALDPLAAALIVPALHLWPWLSTWNRRAGRAGRLALALIPLVAPALVVIYYVRALRLGPLAALWNGALLVAGAHLSMLESLLWSLVAGCLVGAVALGARGAGAARVRPGGLVGAGRVRSPAPMAALASGLDAAAAGLDRASAARTAPGARSGGPTASSASPRSFLRARLRGDAPRS